MPDYFPTPQLPTGLAEEVLRMRSQRGAPWAQLAQSLGQNIGQGFQAHALKQANTVTDPNVLKQAYGGMQSGPQVPSGLQGSLNLPLMGGQQPIPTSAKRPDVEMMMKLQESIQKRKEQETLNDMTTKRMMGVQGLKGEQAATKDHTVASAELLKNYPKIAKMGFEEGMQVPNKFISDQTKPPSGAGSGLQVDRFVQTELDKYDRAINPLNATRGTVLGIVGGNNARNLRAITTLKDPTMVVQQLDNITSDIQAVMQGGAPHEAALAKGRYSNIYTKIAEIKSLFMKSPAPLENPELVKKLGQVLNDLQKVDNSVIKDNLKIQKSKISPTAKKYPEFAKAAKEMEESLLSGSIMSEEGSGPKKYDDVINKVMGGGN